MVILEGIINVLEEDVHKFWNIHIKKSSLKHLLLLQLRSLHPLLRV